MRFVFSTRFKRQYRKLPKILQNRTDERLLAFAANPLHALLHNHALRGTHRRDRSLSVSGDYRLVYREVEPGIALLIDIGTHSELYGK